MSVSTTEEKKCCQKQPPEVFYKKGVLRPQTCNFIKKTLAQVFSCEFFQEHLFHRAPLDNCFCAVS